jgi:hypothetical protein
MASCLLVAGSILLLPAYMRAKYEEKQQLQTINDLKSGKGKENYSAIISELASNSLALGILENTFLEERPSDAIDRIINLRKEVHLNSISYSILGTTTIEMVIEGTAPNRTSLLSFKDRLLSARSNANVDLPLSELVKSSNIPFSLKVTYPKQ